MNELMEKKVNKVVFGKVINAKILLLEHKLSKTGRQLSPGEVRKLEGMVDDFERQVRLN